ncbi:Branched-chain amino acid transport system ATP-binding protein OS=Castellaniella defragrans OX=75697 GN=HNR28_002818 PE=3 SV=1 [Castellaniella defragrans]
MLDVDNLVVRYGPFLACDAIDIRVGQGEIVGVIGPNGAGKSTIARAIAGLVKPASGKITFLGESIVGVAPHLLIRRGLSLVPEGRGLFPYMSVEENLLMGGYALANNKRRKALIERCYDLFPILKERRHQIAGTLSGGQQQMVAVAIGLMGDPQLCVFDEPSLGLAPIVVQQIGEALEALRKLDLTVLLIEQNAKLASTVADHIYVISAGRIQYHDTPEALRQNPEILKKFLSL